ncbi:hypothetical protein CXG81DRAFT_21444 [Caulochytrium protostelioides]|uniref:Uncharacterized protein n=1 Tax=Caulochytrium protostelioides TaxID=1555241 RepID=A0A4P9WXU8_9FUNG|nr:hypothetical protein CAUPRSCDRAFT_11853 [Caulochytrium protostelioides]RKO98309.1 hypothetical protein CXG81DRAFT_21444 [Caulochytrium protostelioides]|eukprot:RKO98309.1 hypothetical protein CXG81DRAFT_21444 [Caulochytrium protostelioides]
MTLYKALLVLLATQVLQVLGHGRMAEPAPRELTYQDNSNRYYPIYSDNPETQRKQSSNPPDPLICGGIRKGDPEMIPVTTPTYVAGQSYKFQYDLSAVHKGDMSFGIAKDDSSEAAFKNITSFPTIVGQTAKGLSPVDVQIPADFPAGPAVIRWYWWSPNTAKPENYVNCADVIITNGSGESTGSSAVTASVEATASSSPVSSSAAASSTSSPVTDGSGSGSGSDSNTGDSEDYEQKEDGKDGAADASTASAGPAASVYSANSYPSTASAPPAAQTSGAGAADSSVSSTSCSSTASAPPAAQTSAAGAGATASSVSSTSCSSTTSTPPVAGASPSSDTPASSAASSSAPYSSAPAAPPAAQTGAVPPVVGAAGGSASGADVVENASCPTVGEARCTKDMVRAVCSPATSTAFKWTLSPCAQGTLCQDGACVTRRRRW